MPNNAMSSTANKLRELEETTRVFIEADPILGAYLPSNLLGIIFILFYLAPPLWILLILNRLLTVITSERIPSLINFMDREYEAILSYPNNNIKHIRFNQADLIHKPHFFSSASRFLIDEVANESGLAAVNAVLSKAANGKIPYLPEVANERVGRYFHQRQAEDLPILDYDGVCYGLLLAWYACIKLEREESFFLNSQSIIRKQWAYFASNKLTKEEKHLISVVNTIQNTQHQQGEHSYGVTFPDADNSEKNSVDIRFEPSAAAYLTVNLNNIEEFFTVAIALAYQAQGELIGVSFRTPTGRHIMGITVHPAKEGEMISYFDANHGKASFLNREDATAAVINLFKFKYRESLKLGKEDNFTLEKFYTANSNYELLFTDPELYFEQLEESEKPKVSLSN